MSLTTMRKWIGSVSQVPDVTIRLVPNGASRGSVLEDKAEDVVTILHSKVLDSYSGYFRTWSERWKGESSSVSLEVQADVCYYLDCFSRMYSLFLKNFDFGLKDFGDVGYSLELLKVASQIQFDELIDSILQSLSSRCWSEEDEDKIREYSSSPDFRRSRAEDLVDRLGLNDESEEDRHKQSYDMLQHLIHTALDPKMYEELLNVGDSARHQCYQPFLERLIRHSADPNATPSNFARTVIMMVTREARNRLDGLNQEYGELDHRSFWILNNRILAMSYVLKTLLAYKVADIELIKSFAHPDAFISKCNGFNFWEHFFKELTELVLLMCQEIVDGRIVFRTPERKAVLANWCPLLKKYIKHGQDPFHRHKLKQVTAKLFSTLPLKDQMEFLQTSLKPLSFFDDFISDNDLELMLSKRCSWPAPSADDPASISSESASKE